MKPLRSVNIVGVLFVSILLILSFVTQSATAAWETHTDRPGMDYKSFWIDKDIEAFVAVKQCEDACKKDSQCKAFTYVKPTANSFIDTRIIIKLLYIILFGKCFRGGNYESYVH